MANQNDVQSVVAVVVTFNRPELLSECLTSLLCQTHPVTHILVVDNASTVDAAEHLRKGGLIPDPRIEVLRLRQNIGGAGGFHTGLKHAAASGAAWIWCLDDDTIPDANCLENLLKADRELREIERPDVLASSIYWIDGCPHIMNGAPPKKYDVEQMRAAARCGCVSIRAATFVSILVRANQVRRYGLPYKDFFIWCDDYEYTARILRTGFGVFVPESRALHKTATNHNCLANPGSRHYYSVRNTIWMVRYSSAFNFEEKLALSRHVARTLVVRHLFRHGFSRASLSLVVRGVRDGLFGRLTSESAEIECETPGSAAGTAESLVTGGN